MSVFLLSWETRIRRVRFSWSVSFLTFLWIFEHKAVGLAERSSLYRRRNSWLCMFPNSTKLFCARELDFLSSVPFQFTRRFLHEQPDNCPMYPFQASAPLTRFFFFLGNPKLWKSLPLAYTPSGFLQHKKGKKTSPETFNQFHHSPVIALTPKTSEKARSSGN